MKLTITINIDNLIYPKDRELQQTLQRVVNKSYQYNLQTIGSLTLYDGKGNVVGSIVTTEEKKK